MSSQYVQSLRTHVRISLDQEARLVRHLPALLQRVRADLHLRWPGVVHGEVGPVREAAAGGVGWSKHANLAAAGDTAGRTGVRFGSFWNRRVLPVSSCMGHGSTPCEMSSGARGGRHSWCSTS